MASNSSHVQRPLKHLSERKSFLSCDQRFKSQINFQKSLKLNCISSNLKRFFFPKSSFFGFMTFLFFLLLNQSLPVSAQPPETMHIENRCDPNRTETDRICRRGVILPVWPPANTTELTTAETAGKAIFYLLFLIFLFLGVSIIADRFMASIEVITSKEKEVVYKTKTGQEVVTTVRIWNETVSNLTLMALGSSAPEIMLSIIEIIGRGFHAGDLGPSTIVGSASFNLFIIIAMCMYVIPDGESRKVKHPRVFFVTAVWSVLAYIWLYVILAVSSYGVVEIWEGVVTFLFFPLLVVFAWIADRRLLIYKLMYKRYRARRRNVIVETEGDPEIRSTDGENNFHMAVVENGVVHNDEDARREPNGAYHEQDDLLAEHDVYKRDLITLMRSLKKANPDASMDEIGRLARAEILSSQPKSRAFYRIQAIRKMTGSGNILNKEKLGSLTSSQSLIDFKEDPTDTVAKIFFDPPEYKVLENCGSVELNVVRQGGDLQSTLFVDYKTDDGTANAGSDYVATEDTILFRPGESLKKIKIKIIDDDIFEEDEYFTVSLFNVRLGTIDGMFDTDENSTQRVKLEAPSVARVIILDDDHAGVFSFESNSTTVSEGVGVMKIEVLRNSGSRGKVFVPYKTISGSAKGGGIDYEDVSGELEFDNDEISSSPICVEILDNNKYNSYSSFSIALGQPYYETNILDGSECDLLNEEQRRIAELGKPRLGEFPKLEVIIEESYEFKSTVDKLIKKANLAVVVGSSSWREQFADALSVNGGGDNDGDGDEVTAPTTFDYVMHFLTVFWKLLFAFVPPTDYFGGWACFSFSIIVIGFLTAIIGDVASHFGCIVNLNDAVTAVTLVAMGTSVPDTFASKVAAIGDQYADASIGNVTGSNAVNVFLGIGIAWTVAAIYWAVTGETPEAQKFRVQPGNLAFSVTVFFAFACVAFLILVYRRRSSTINAELGGPRTQKIISSSIFVTLWLLYILLATLDSYCVISTF